MASLARSFGVLRTRVLPSRHTAQAWARPLATVATPEAGAPVTPATSTTTAEASAEFEQSEILDQIDDLIEEQYEESQKNPLQRWESKFTSTTKRVSQLPCTYLPISNLKSKNPTAACDSNLAIPLVPLVFSQPLRQDILHRCRTYHLANLRQGTASTKDRGEVAYSKRKLAPQKGTGRARVGSAGSGVRRGGGVIHGPKPRDWSQDLPRKVRAMGLHVALTSKTNSGLLRVVESVGQGQWQKTREAIAALADDEPSTELSEPSNVPVTRFGPKEHLSILFVYGPSTPESELASLIRSTSNIGRVDIVPVDELNAYDVLLSKWTVLDTSSVEFLAIRAGQDDRFDNDPMSELNGEFAKPVKFVWTRDENGKWVPPAKMDVDELDQQTVESDEARV